jgi:hypothetical protein
MAAAGFDDLRVQTVPGWQQHIVHTFLGRRPATDEPARIALRSVDAPDVDPEAMTPPEGIDMPTGT